MLTVTDRTWDEQVTRAPTPVLVMFSAVWCKPCAAAVPVVERFEAAARGKVRVLKADVEQTAGAAVDAGVCTVPTFVLYGAGGQIVGRHVGVDARLVDTLRGMVGVLA